MGNKIGRNSRCTCGSGKKYKHCCGAIGPRFKDKMSKSLEQAGMTPDMIAQVKKWHHSVMLEHNWPDIYGDIIPSANAIIEDEGKRIVSAGNKLYKIDLRETWYGFIYDLLRSALGVEWFDMELLKPPDEQHTLAVWYREVCARELDEEQLFTGWNPQLDTGATLAFRSLAYDHFCLMQAMAAPSKVIARLRHPSQFEGARYELWVAASLARAGYTLEFLDEDDRSEKHGELIATHRKSGDTFWVEVKRNHRANQDHASVLASGGLVKVDAKLVAKAMQKPALHTRLIFIDVNAPPWKGDVTKTPWMIAFRKSLNLLERQQPYRGNLNARAFVLVTNHPYHYVTNMRPNPRTQLFGTAFNMPELDPSKVDQSHPRMIELMSSLTKHFDIPSIFIERP